MTFKEWKEWFKTVPRSMRWFVFLIFLRPIIDNFYFLKEVSPFLSPLNIIGILTPFLIFFSTYKKKPPHASDIDKFFKFWAIILSVGIIVMGIGNLFSIEYYETILKISLVFYLYYFSRYFIKNRKDLEGVLQVFLYSSVFIIAIFFYEEFGHPIKSEMSRGVERIMGNYADVFNYAIYIVLCTLINFYFFLKPDSTLSKAKRLRNVIITLIFGVAMLFRINHIASYGVFAALIIIYLIISFKQNAVIGLGAFSIVLTTGYFFGKETIDRKIMPLLQTDIRVYSGEIESSYYLHGRVGRWERFIDVFDGSSLVVQFVGLPVSNVEQLYMYLAVAPHNDFLRILFCTGYLGLFCYLIILGIIAGRIMKYSSSLLFLGAGSLAIIVLYSISSVPTLYSSLLYVVLSIFSFFALPRKKLDARFR